VHSAQAQQGSASADESAFEAEGDLLVKSADNSAG
jgi:hypothetical protein